MADGSPQILHQKRSFPVNPFSKLTGSKFLVPVALFGLSMVVFSSSLANFFVSDDFTLMEMSRFRSLGQLASFFTTAGFGHYYRPVVCLLFSLNSILFGLRPSGYHLVNIVLHSLNVVLIYYLAKRLAAETAPALLAALFFSLHFIHAEAVLWISGVTGLMATFFYLLSVLLFMEHLRRWPAGWLSLILSCFCFLLALLSKEMTVTLPLLIFVLALGLGFRQPGRSWRSLAWRLAPYGGLLLILGLVRASVQARMPELAQEGGAFALNPLVMMRNLAYYGVNLVVPVRVIFDFLGYERYVGLTVLFQRQEVLLLILLMILAGFFIWGMGLLLRKGSRLGKIGLLWLMVTLIPFLLFRDVGQRFAYLPSAGFCLLLADLFRPRGEWSTWGARPLLIVVMLTSLLAIQERNIWWKRAGCQAEALLSNIKGFCWQIRKAHQLHVVGVPPRLHGAYVFNNGLGSAINLVCGKDKLKVTQHAHLGSLEGGDLAPGNLVLVYQNGEMFSWPPSQIEPSEQGGDL
jgi:hypothetical protein